MPFSTALHSVSYAGFWGQARLSLDEFSVKARDLGFSAVMLMAKRPHLSPLDFDAAARARLRDRLGALDLRVACLAGYNDFNLGAERPDIPCREMQLVYIRELARLASDLDCSTVRVFTGYCRGTDRFDQEWAGCVSALREAARLAADFGVTLAVQNHHDLAAGYESLRDLLEEVAAPNCRAAFDAWAPALHGADLRTAVETMAPFTVHTTVADYVRRPRVRYEPALVNYVREADSVRAVPMGAGFIDYREFFRALRETGYGGCVAYEMCSPLKGGGTIDNLDRCARQFLKFMADV